MTMYPDSQARRVELDYGTDERAVFNFFNAVYAWMAVGLAVTAAVAYLVSQNATVMAALYSKGVIVAALLGTWVLAMGIQSVAMRLGAAAATALFILYSGCIGMLMSYIFVVYHMQTIAAAFVLTGGTFGVMSVYGYVTKRDLTGIGSFLIMGAIGLFIASIINVFIASSFFSWVLTYGVLVVFLGLMAYDTQKLRQIAENVRGNGDLAKRYAIIGSLMLYVDFINVFASILRILGNRR